MNVRLLLTLFFLSSSACGSSTRFGENILIKGDKLALNLTVNMVASESHLQQINVVAELKNNSPKSIFYFDWNTPLEGKLYSNLYDISVEGTTIPYTGIFAKRSYQKNNQAKEIASKDTAKVSTDIFPFYDWCKATASTAKLKYNGEVRIKGSAGLKNGETEQFIEIDLSQLRC